MAIENVSAVQNLAQNAAVISVVSAVGAISQTKSSETDFSNVMNRYESTNTAADRRENGRIGSGAKTSKSQDSIKLNQKKEVTQQDAETVVSDIRDVVKDVLDLSDEELDNALNEAGLTVADLLNPQNIVALLAQMQQTAPESILTDGTLSEQLTDLTQGIADIINRYASENQVPLDQVIGAVNTYFADDVPAVNDGEDEADFTEMPTQETAQTVSTLPDVQKATVTLDSETGKEIRFTVEHNIVTSEEITVEKPYDQADGEAETSKDGRQSEPKENFATQILANLSESVEQAAQTYEELSSGYVDGADVVRQMLDAVKVHVTEEIQSMEIQLTPENLGKLSLTVAAKDGVITASITAQNEAVKSAIENQLFMLKDTLNEQGLKVESVEVTVASHEFDANFMNNGKNETDDQTKSNARRRFRGIDELLDEESADSAEQVLKPADGRSIDLTA